MNIQNSGPCATTNNAWHNEHHQKAAHAPAEDHESKSSQRHDVAHHPLLGAVQSVHLLKCPVGTLDLPGLPCSIGGDWQPILKWKSKLSDLSFLMD